MSRNRPIWTIILALIVSCGYCQGVTINSLRATQQKEGWHVENALIPSQDSDAQVRRTSTQAATNARHDSFWNAFDLRNDWKTNFNYDSTFTLTNFKYLCVPTWWADQDETDPALAVNVTEDAIDRLETYFANMSWNKFSLTIEGYEQVKLNVTSEEPLLQDARKSLTGTLKERGRVIEDSFDGLILIHHNAQAGNAAGGGSGTVNGRYVFHSVGSKTAFPGFNVARHEIGHNFGQGHHRSMLTLRRDPDDFVKEGFDMMSGANDLNVSDYAPGGKWFWNWIPDSSIVILQPEGPTERCPDCEIGGTYTIHPFDKPEVTPEGRIMAIQIPIMAVATGDFYSIWLSYRSGVDGLASGGLGVHAARITLGGLFGGRYRAYSYDAHGSTESVFDSFVLPDTCYVIEPPLLIPEIDFPAKQVVPQVCVDSLNVGTDITVTVSFLDPNLLYQASSRPQQPDQEFDCSFDGETSITQSISGESSKLIHVSNTGSDGIIFSDLCSTDVEAYIYDSYPLLPLESTSTPPEYGAFPAFSDDLCTAQTFLGEAWLWLKQAPSNDTDIRVWCQMTSCLQNQYRSDNSCVQCPDNNIAPPGSTDISNCSKCLDGFTVPDPQAKKCALSEDFDESITSSNGWRIWAPAELSTKPISVRVNNMKMYSTSDCTGNEVVIDLADVTLVHSGSAPKNTPDKAFQDKDRWGGKPDDDGLFYLGVMFNQHVTVRCMRISFGNKYMTEIRVQAFIESEDKWENVHIEKNVAGGEIDVGWITVNSPTMQPSKSPSMPPVVEQDSLFDIDPAAAAKLFLNFFLELLWQLLLSFSDAARRLLV